MAVNYPKTEEVVFGLPAATATTMIQVGSNRVNRSQASVQVCGQHCAGRRGAGQGAPEEVVLSREGLQIPQGNSVLLQEGGAGLQAQVLQISGAAAAHVRCSRVLGPHRGRPSTMAA